MLFLKLISKDLLLQELALAVLQNKLGVYCRQLTVQEGEDLRLQGIQGILVHFLSVLQQLEGAKTLMQPLIGLMKQPQQYSVGSLTCTLRFSYKVKYVQHICLEGILTPAGIWTTVLSTEWSWVRRFDCSSMLALPFAIDKWAISWDYGTFHPP